MRFFYPALAATLLAACLSDGSGRDASAEDNSVWRSVPIERTVDRVQPWTGIVLWTDNEKNETDAIQLEYRYVGYDEVVQSDGSYDWSIVDDVLNDVAGRSHQAILRFYYVYPGNQTTVPGHIKAMTDYQEVVAKSEGEKTSFVDWSHSAVQEFTLDFFGRFAKRYDQDRRLAYLQVGFGLWGEYHIYDGPRTIGETFPTKAFQAKFLRHLDQVFDQTPWMISIDAADGDYSPFEQNPGLKLLGFGLFDDSFLCKPHPKENALNWHFFGRDRWMRAPAGGEFSYYNKRDQKRALSDSGPNGVSFEQSAKDFHVTFMIGNDQPRYQSLQRIKQAGIASGYRLRVDSFETSAQQTRIQVSNTGIAPMYHDAFFAVGGVRTRESLRGLMPGETRRLLLPVGNATTLEIESDRLVPGQSIQFDAAIRR